MRLPRLRIRASSAYPLMVVLFTASLMATTMEADDRAPTGGRGPGSRRDDLVGSEATERARIAEIVCPVEGGSTILAIPLEGTRVKKGQALCQLDDTDLRERKINGEIATKRAEAERDNARKRVEVAELDLTLYTEATAPREKVDAEAEERLARAEHTVAIEELEHIKRAAGADDLTRRRAEVTVARAAFTLSRAEDRLRRMPSEQEGAIIGLKAEIEKARSNALACEQMHELKMEEFRNLGQIIDACRPIAPFDGVIIYPNPSRTSRVGETIGQGQVILRVVEAALPAAK